jgi:eukaryotic-like serine/threonine-protein kinase
MSQRPSPAAPAGEQDFYEFGIYRLEVSTRSLFRNGEFVPLPPKVLETLLILVEEAGYVVTKDELMQRIWPDTYVEEGSIANNISALRKLLNPDFEGEGPIATVPKRGYRFTAELRLRNAAREITVHAAAAPAETKPVEEEAPPPDDAEPQSFWSRYKIILQVGIGLLILFAAIYNFYFLTATAHGKLSEKDTIVITDFNNKTKDTVFDDTLKQALTFDLEQSPLLNILPDRKVENTLKLMGRADDERVTADVGRDVCQRVNSKAMLVGEISALESEYLIGLQAINCATGDVLVSEQARASGRAQVLKALDQAAFRMRGRLGESLASIQKFSVPADEVTTPSLEALKAYGVARALNNAKGDVYGLPGLQHAVELDPNFAVAYSALGTSYENLGQTANAREAALKAYNLRSRISERERLRIVATYYGFGTGDIEKSIDAYSLWEQEYPRDAVPYINNGLNKILLGKYPEAQHDTEEALRLEPNNVIATSNLAEIQLSLNHPEEAKATLENAFSRNLDAFFMRMNMYQTAFVMGDQESMKKQLDWGVGRPGEEDWLLGAQADTEAYYGRSAAAHDYLRRAAESAKRADSSEMFGVWNAKDALFQAEFGNVKQAHQLVNTAVANSSGSDMNCLAALALARAGSAAEAERLIDAQAKETPQDTAVIEYWQPTIKAAIALQTKNPSRAIELLQTAEPIELGQTSPFEYGTLYPAYLRGEAYLALHQGKEAQAEFQKLLTHYGIIANFPLGSLAQLGLARSFAVAGDSAASRAEYDKFLALWKTADPDLPLLRQARAERVALK